MSVQRGRIDVIPGGSEVNELTTGGLCSLFHVVSFSYVSYEMLSSLSRLTYSAIRVLACTFLTWAVATNDFSLGRGWLDSRALVTAVCGSPIYLTTRRPG